MAKGSKMKALLMEMSMKDMKKDKGSKEMPMESKEKKGSVKMAKKTKSTKPKGTGKGC